MIFHLHPLMIDAAELHPLMLEPALAHLALIIFVEPDHTPEYVFKLTA